jgi:hypothetical protein
VAVRKDVRKIFRVVDERLTRSGVTAARDNDRVNPVRMRDKVSQAPL